MLVDYRGHCEFRERATAEVTGLTAAKGKSFYPPLTGQDSFGVRRGEKDRIAKRERERERGSVQPLHEPRIGGRELGIYMKGIAKLSRYAMAD